MGNAILKPDWFKRQPLIIAPELLGKFLVRKIGNDTIALPISEVEVYAGIDDLASHARFGRTNRNARMFGPGGFWYVYLIYGMYWMLNITTGPESEPSGILIRGVQGISGPGRVTEHFGITGGFNSLPAEKSSSLWIEDRGIAIPKSKILRTPRIGVAYAGPIWSQKKWRFVVKE